MRSNSILTLALLATLTSCASIVSKSKYPVSIQSDPTGLEFDVVDKSGKTVHHGTTPQVVTLDADAGFFQRARYVVHFHKNVARETDAELTSSLDPWYFGNILFGGLIGLVIVDPLTGAMWKLPKEFLTTVPTELATLGPSDGN
jgi:hypothetical protein